MSGGKTVVGKRADECLDLALRNLNEAYYWLELVDKEGAKTRAVGGVKMVLCAIMEARGGRVGSSTAVTE